MQWLAPRLVDVAGTAGVLLLAPFAYFFAGLPWAVATRRISWAPLWGVGVLGLTAEYAGILGFSVPAAVTAVAALHWIAGAVLAGRSPSFGGRLRTEGVAFAAAYAIALCPLVAAPFATPGLWGGDWAVALRSGTSLLQGTRFTPDLLARPPLFGAASTLALLAAPPMQGFQVFCAVASACALQVFRSGLNPRADPKLLWILAGSVFFLQITANAWPKFLCAAFLLASWQALGAKNGRRLLTAGVLLGLALATHQSAALFVPLLLTRVSPPGERWRPGEALLVLAAAAFIAGAWEVHTVLSYGLQAKIHANPSVSARLEDVPAWLNALLVGFTTFVAWGPLFVVRHWYESGDRFSVFRLEHEVYWFSTSFFNSSAGSLMGLALPWWLALGTKDFLRRLRGLWKRMDGKVRLGLVLALAGQMILNPYYSGDGSLQTGWVPVGLALALWFAKEMGEADPEVLKRVLRCILWIGALPWFAFNGGLTALLVLASRFRGSFYDSDLELLDKNRWLSLGMDGFPFLQAALVVFLFLALREQARPSPESTAGQN